MIEFFLRGALDLLWGWVGLSTIIGIGAIAVAVLLPPFLTALVPGLRVLAIYVAIGAFTFNAVATTYYAKGAIYGAESKAAEWKRGSDLEEKQGEKAGTDAERAVASEPASERLFRSDPYNRDNRRPD
jgi:hypothetical protein